MSQKPSISVCCVSMNMGDRMRLIDVPVELVDGFREAARQGWSLGIQNETTYHGSHEFKFKGNPWFGQGDQAVPARCLIISVLTFMARNGWNLLQSADISKQKGDKDTLFFEYGYPDPEAQVFSVSFNMTDRIRVIGAPEMMPIVSKAVQSHWKSGIQKESSYCGALELKLAGSPWHAMGGDTVYVRTLLNHILADIRSTGYKLYGSIDISYGHEGRDMESWFFRKVGQQWN